MAGFGSSSNTFGGKAGSFRSRTKPASNSLPGSFGKPSVGGGGGAGPSLGAPQSRPSPTIQRGGGGRGGPLGAPRSQQASLPPPKPVNVSAPKPTGRSNINVTADRNPQLDALLGQQQSNIDDLKNNTGLASDATAIRTADAFEGAKNAAQYSGGEGGSGVRDTRQQQITDAGLRENARRQTDLTLGREGMITGAIQNQLGTIMGQQSGMLGQQQIGLGAEGLRQQAGRDQFGQGLAGQQFAADVGFRNQDNAWRAANQQLQGLQGVNQMQQGWGGSGWGGGGGGGYGIPASGFGSPGGPGGAGPGGSTRRGGSGGFGGGGNRTRINT